MNKNEKGITLIALIITIIIMLILVTVTINVALNGGLFGKAKKAGEDTQIAADKEELLSAVWSAYNEKTGAIERTKLVEALDSRWNISTGTAPFTCTSPKGNAFIVDRNGIITETTAETPGTFSWASVGLAGADTSADYKLIVDNSNNGYMINFVDDGTIELRQIITGQVISQQMILDAKENTSTNPLTISAEGFGTVSLRILESGYLEATIGQEIFVYTKMTENIGRKVTYNQMNWYVLYDDSYHGTQLISANALGSVNLDRNSFSEARASYNGAIETLIDECKQATSINSNIRNVGGPSTDLTTMNQTVDFSELDAFQMSVDDSNFTQYEGSTNGIKIADTNYIEDEQQMRNLGILVTDTPANYRISSRCVDVNTDNNMVWFRVRYISDSGYLYTGASILSVNSNGEGLTSFSNSTYGVRPVITIDSSVLSTLPNAGN